MRNWKKVNQWSNTKLYQANNGKMTVNVEITTTKDKLGSLKKAECSLFGIYESYSMIDIKDRVFITLALKTYTPTE